MNPADLYSPLLDALKADVGRCLWLLDENSPKLEALPPASQLSLITNRFDLFQHYQALGAQVQFTDFDFTPWQTASLDRIVAIVSKEKALTHYWINQAAEYLKPGGELILFGEKSGGIKTYARKAATLLGCPVEQTKLFAETWRLNLYKQALSNSLLDDQNYAQLRWLEHPELNYFAKPGVYGWQKIDAGSAFLMQTLADRFPLKGRVLDLGCGFGYLSLKAAGPDTLLCCTDNNAAALSACQANIDHYQLQGEVIAANAGAGITPGFDYLLCNPPFHTGFATRSDLTERFVRAAAQLLDAQGDAFFVVNLHIGLETHAKNYFQKVDVLANNGHFKLIHLRQPKNL